MQEPVQEPVDIEWELSLQRLAEARAARDRQIAADARKWNPGQRDTEAQRRADLERVREGMRHLSGLIADLEFEIREGRRIYRSAEGLEFHMEPYKLREVVEEELRDLKRQLRECRVQEAEIARRTIPPTPTLPAKKNPAPVVEEDPSGPPDPGLKGW